MLQLTTTYLYLYLSDRLFFCNFMCLSLSSGFISTLILKRGFLWPHFQSMEATIISDLDPNNSIRIAIPATVIM